MNDTGNKLDPGNTFRTLHPPDREYMFHDPYLLEPILGIKHFKRTSIR